MEKRTGINYAKRNEDLFIAGVEYLSHKYGIDMYTLVTKSGYHFDSDGKLDYERLAKAIRDLTGIK